MSVTQLPNNISVAYTEVALEDMPQEEFGDKIAATRVLRCAWGSRWQLAQELMPAITPGANLIDVVVRMPHRYPYRTDLGLYCTSVSMSPWAGNPAAGTPGPYLDAGPKLAWEWAFLHAHYETLQTDNATALIWQEALRPCAEFITIPNTALYWYDGTPVDPSSSPGFTLKKIEWTVTRRYAPTTFPSIVLSYQGSVNLNTVTSGLFPGLSFTAGKLLYNGVDIEEDRFSDGSPAVKLVYHFTGQSASWNQFPHHIGTGTSMPFETIYKDAGHSAAFVMYPSVALENLFGW